MEDVTLNEILEAKRLVEETENISIGYEASAAVAGFAKQRQNGKIAKDETVVINLTGGR